MAGHVYEREVDAVDHDVREAEIDCDPARFLFLQAVRVGAGQSAHECALAVIDVSGGSDDDCPEIGGHWPIAYLNAFACAAAAPCGRAVACAGLSHGAAPRGCAADRALLRVPARGCPPARGRSGAAPC